jgi:hypothetical protein
MRQRWPHRASLVALLLFAGLMILIAVPPRGSSHEPITTKVMFNKEIVRIFQRNCLGCHGPNSITGISLANYEQARPWAKAIKEEVIEKRMPPYQPVKGYGRFQHDYLLPQREIDLLISWVEGGAPKGEDKDYPRELIEAKGWTLGQPDLLLQPESETKLSADGDDEYRCFTLPTKLGADRWVSAIDFRPGNPAVVHCASLQIDPAGSSRMVEVANQAKGECGPNGHESAAGSLFTWVPGQAVTRLPDGIGRLLPAGARLLMRVHYRNNGEEMSDRSIAALYFANEETVRPLRAVTLTAEATQVPPGAERHRVKAAFVLPEAAEVVAIRPLLFPFGKSVEAIAYRPDGRAEVLIWARNYRYDWQPPFYFKKPIALPKGTRIELTAYLNNSENNPSNPQRPPQPVRFAQALGELYFATAPAK